MRLTPQYVATKHMSSLRPVGGRVGHPEAGSDRVCRPLCWDLQRRQQAQTLHSYCNDWLPRSGAAGELANEDMLMSPLFGIFWVSYRDLSMKCSMDPDGKPYGFSQAWPRMFYTLAGDCTVQFKLA